ncbi:MAG: DUF4144 family protein [Candidatus Methylopumilus sp.]
MIHWPAIIQLTGEAELTYIENQSLWDRDMHLQAINYEASDRLIDSYGVAYALSRKADGKVIPERSETIVALDTVIQLIRAHAAQIGLCCIAKISAGSFQEAISLVSSMDDNGVVKS